MDAAFSAGITIASEDQMTALGRRLAPVLRPGDTILLRGPIGAGKTHLARAIIQARLATAGLFEDVPSPTYTLVQVYSDGEADIWHADLYRLTGSHEVSELGLDEAFGSAIVLVEWPDRLGPDAPGDALVADFTVLDGGRHVRLTSASPKWARISAALTEAA